MRGLPQRVAQQPLGIGGHECGERKCRKTHEGCDMRRIGLQDAAEDRFRLLAVASEQCRGGLIHLPPVRVGGCCALEGDARVI